MIRHLLMLLRTLRDDQMTVDYSFKVTVTDILTGWEGTRLAPAIELPISLYKLG